MPEKLDDSDIEGQKKWRRIGGLYILTLIVLIVLDTFFNDVVLGLIIHIGWTVPFFVSILYFSNFIVSRAGLVLATIVITVLAILGYFGYLRFLGDGYSWGPLGPGD